MASRTYRYTTADDDLRVLLDKITDNVVNDTIVNYMIDIACDQIDGKLVYMYDVPFTSTPPMVKHAATHLAAYLVLRRQYVRSRDAEGNAWIDVFKDFGNDIIKSIVEGDVILVDASGDNISRKAVYGIKSSTADYVPIFNEGDALEWEVDPDKVSAETKGR